MKKALLLISVYCSLFTVQAQEKGTYTDTRDGKVYKTVKIVTQTWFAENIAFKTDSGCWAYKNDKANVAKYGYLYNWETAKTVCPKGWHLPSYEEWTQLIDTLGGVSIAGGKLKATTDWTYDAYGKATNESGFNALPAGYRYRDNDLFDQLGYNVTFWSGPPDGSEYAWYCILRYNNVEVGRSYTMYPPDSFSVRCIKD